MQEISTNVLLAFALVALAVIIVMVFLIRRLMGIGNAEQAFVAPATAAPAAVPTQMPQAASPLPIQTQPVSTSSSPPSPRPSPSPAPSPSPPSRAPQPRTPSYAEIAVAEAPYAPARPIVQPKAIDYSNEAADAGPAASYTAIAVAEGARRAGGGAPSARTAPARVASAPAAPAPAAAASNGAAPARPAPSSASAPSYTAIALAAVGQPRPKTAEPIRAQRIDYSGMPGDLGPNASYTAIAVAAAARAAGA